MSLSEDIKDFALDLGYSKVGITTANPFPEYVAELKSRYQMYSWFIEGPRQLMKGADPRSLMPEAKSIVVLAHDYYKTSFPEELLGRIGRLYQARAYIAPPHRLNGARRQLMKEFLEKKRLQGAGRPVHSRTIVRRQSRGGNLWTKHFRLCRGKRIVHCHRALPRDKELEYDNPTMEVKCPPKCTACIDACPTAAILEPLKMNPFRCIAFNTFTTQDGRPGISSNIPPEIRRRWEDGFTAAISARKHAEESKKIESLPAAR